MQTQRTRLEALRSAVDVKAILIATGVIAAMAATLTVAIWMAADVARRDQRGSPAHSSGR